MVSMPAILLLVGSLASLASAEADADANPEPRLPRHLGGGPGHSHDESGTSNLDADDPDFSGVVDFSNAIPGPGGSWCITKTKYVEHMVKDQIKECWHQNVTQCHDTYVTEFLPSQEQKCEESFWKSCKIDFREMPYNYSMKQCHTPLMKICDPNTQSFGKPEIVCKTWFESECNTTYTETTPNVEDKPSTWCKKVPRKICAPDNCKMVPGDEQCSEKMLVSTVQKPTELCDLQPQQHCRLITKLTPHLISKEVCRNIPKEVCHLALSPPKMIRKPITLKWCTRKKDGILSAQGNNRGPQQPPTYKPSYLPPPPPSAVNNRQGAPRPQQQQSGASSNSFPVQPTYGSPSSRPIQNFQLRSDDPGPTLAAYASAPKEVIYDEATKFPPPTQKFFKNHPSNKRSDPGTETSAAAAAAVKQVPSESLQPPAPEKDIFGADIVQDVFQPVFQEQFQPAASVIQSHSVQVPSTFEHYTEQDIDRLLEQLEKEELEELAQERLDRGEQEIVFVDGQPITTSMAAEERIFENVEEEEEDQQQLAAQEQDMFEQKKEEQAKKVDDPFAEVRAPLKAAEEHTQAPVRSASITDELMSTGFGALGGPSSAGEMFGSPRNAPGSFLGRRRRR